MRKEAGYKADRKKANKVKETVQDVNQAINKQVPVIIS